MKSLFKTERLLLTEAYPGDATYFARHQLDDNFAQLSAWDVETPRSPQRFINMLNATNPTHFIFVMRLQSTDQPLGWIELTNVSLADQTAELGIGIFVGAQRNHGYGREAIEGLLTWGFGELGLFKINLSVNENNPMAIHVYEQVGFKREATDREALLADGRWLDRYVYGLLRSDWRQ
ncbi:GNAT family N-acetyltransferase [Furfurilactobacillus curtus]|uniref:Acetyltransferase n=1 Tax=Furfurilactobacillus curtus TaxID=1746200 RepID=A0ABQ5JRJ2_9LACO